jgi:LCP family protein required for cell wall assembly
MNNLPQMARPPRKTSLTTFILLGLLLVVGILVVIVAFNIVRNIVTSWTLTDIGGAPVIGDLPTPTALPDGVTPQPTQPVIGPGGGPEPKPWDGTSRVTILVVGLDYRDWEAGSTASRSDTMILLTVDPVKKTAGILTIPRDLWVNIPNYGYYKINQAYYFGELDNLPDVGGPGLAIATVEQLLGVPIDYFAQVDFNAFIRVIDEIGGIKIEVSQEITIDPIGPGNTVVLDPGTHTLPGDLALAYARNRKTAGGDFDRGSRQRQVIMAIRDRVMELGIGTLVEKAPVLYQEISAGVHTNLSLDQAISLAWTVSQIPPENIVQAAIGTEQVIMARSADNLDILVPMPDKIREVRDLVFSTAGAIGPAAVAGNPMDLVLAEKARLSVRNGAGYSGLANSTADYFKGKGLDVPDVGDASDSYAYSTLYIYNAKPYTAQYLQDLMNITSNHVITQFTPDAVVDIMVVLGNDWGQSNPMP